MPCKSKRVRQVIRWLTLALILAGVGGGRFATNGVAAGAGTFACFERRCCGPEAAVASGVRRHGCVWEAYVNGVIVAPERRRPATLWDEIAVALVVLPPESGQHATRIDQVIETAMIGLRESGRNPETLQRQERTVDGQPAQMIKVRYHDSATSRDWIEELVFIAGPDQEIYSVALKSVPEHLKPLEPVLAGILQSWKLGSTAAPAAGADTATRGDRRSSRPSTVPH